MRGVIACEVRIGLGAAEIVHRHDLDRMLLAVLVVGTKDVASDPAVAVDRNLDRHAVLLVDLLWMEPVGIVDQWRRASAPAASVARSRKPYPASIRSMP